ncbi:CD209 antigen-like protein E [Cyclopterus lumpus]|uniref:CD209 antigen-like protein E n=1 Tax=Cyclopterus lumpus TaxID=8103 RepID=UPI0014874FC8|nr:CD209 antigen-like protein E [Cyclopterus lumpus]
MENSQSQSEPGEELSFEQNISQDFNTDGYSGSHHQTFGQERGGSVFPHHRVVILSLGLLDAVLLITAVVIGIYCAKGENLQVPHSATSPIIIELNHLHNNSDIIKAKLEAEAQLVTQHDNHLQLKRQLKQIIIHTDRLQAQMETLQTEKTNLQSNKTAVEESCGRCLQGWRLLNSSCYYFSHHASNSKKNWPDSRAHCISQGGDLLVINNLAEQQLITDNYATLKSSNLWWQNGFWIGLTDVVIPGTWVWVNNVTEVETTYWRSGQPSNEGLQSGNCAAFYHLTDTKGEWYNGNCIEHLYNWICEMQPS